MDVSNLLINICLEHTVNIILKAASVTSHPYRTESALKSLPVAIFCEQRQKEKDDLALKTLAKRKATGHLNKSGKQAKVVEDSGTFMKSPLPSSKTLNSTTPSPIQNLSFNETPPTRLENAAGSSSCPIRLNRTPSAHGMREVSSCPPVRKKNADDEKDQEQVIEELKYQLVCQNGRLTFLENQMRVLSSKMEGPRKRNAKSALPEKVLTVLKSITSEIQLADTVQAVDPEANEVLRKESVTNSKGLRRGQTKLRSELFCKFKIDILFALDNLNVALKCLDDVRFSKNNGKKHHILRLVYGENRAAESLLDEEDDLPQLALHAAFCFLFQVENEVKTLRPWAQRVFVQVASNHNVRMPSFSKLLCKFFFKEIG